MYRAQPTVSKLLNKKWNEKQQQFHEQRIKEMKPTHTITEPKQFSHLVTKPKRT
jgi:hypothetical protein